MAVVRDSRIDAGRGEEYRPTLTTFGEKVRRGKRTIEVAAETDVSWLNDPPPKCGLVTRARTGSRHRLACLSPCYCVHGRATEGAPSGKMVVKQ
jgi:hypothetical protein